jgi:hypothetical protein
MADYLLAYFHAIVEFDHSQYSYTIVEQNIIEIIFQYPYDYLNYFYFQKNYCNQYIIIKNSNFRLKFY